jgi:hypothetical protein
MDIFFFLRSFSRNFPLSGVDFHGNLLSLVWLTGYSIKSSFSHGGLYGNFLSCGAFDGKRKFFSAPRKKLNKLLICTVEYRSRKNTKKIQCISPIYSFSGIVLNFPKIIDITHLLFKFFLIYIHTYLPEDYFYPPSTKIFFFTSKYTASKSDAI